MNDLYCCDVQRLTISEPNTLITNVPGTHLYNLGLADVKYLKIDKQNVKFLPINIAEYFPNLKKIRVSNSKLEYITEKDFRGLTQLSVMFMTSNKLKDLPCGVFDTNIRLEKIHFGNNSLIEIGAGIFKPLPLLNVLHFRNNNCIDKNAGNTSELAGLLNEIETKCFMDCETPRVYPISNKELENTVNNITGKDINLTTEIEALRVEIFKIIKEKKKRIRSSKIWKQNIIKQLKTPKYRKTNSKTSFLAWTTILVKTRKKSKH